MRGGTKAIDATDFMAGEIGADKEVGDATDVGGRVAKDFEHNAGEGTEQAGIEIFKGDIVSNIAVAMGLLFFEHHHSNGATTDSIS